MRFTIKQANLSGERIGTLTGFMKSPNTVIETPTAALLTQVFNTSQCYCFKFMALITNHYDNYSDYYYAPVINEFSRKTSIVKMHEVSLT